VWASRILRLSWLDNGEPGAQGQPLAAAFPKGFIEAFVWLARIYESSLSGPENQLFSSGLIRLANSSNEVSPLIFSPLTKKVGVESTFSTSAAYF
jgi:hypothetical protein